ncbi:nuclear transport factor 2 family protein [Micromonospora sp. NPDC000316]|uniref:nuclear transport factor 2 family protein n=1 Tax=Micromonospora sp. NPDC000316 TaxID=3364216 RepID=UPI003682D77E
MSVDVQELIDRAEITDVLVAYCQAQDQQEWHLLDAVFTDDAVMELPGSGLDGTLSPAAFRAFLVERFTPTRLSGQHSISNTLFRIHGDTARTISELASITLQTTDTEGVLSRTQANSLYVDDFVRTTAGWRIKHRVISQKNVEIDTVTYAPELIETIRRTSAFRWL